MLWFYFFFNMSWRLYGLKFWTHGWRFKERDYFVDFFMFWSFEVQSECTRIKTEFHIDFNYNSWIKALKAKGIQFLWLFSLFSTRIFLFLIHYHLVIFRHNITHLTSSVWSQRGVNSDTGSKQLSWSWIIVMNSILNILLRDCLLHFHLLII